MSADNLKSSAPAEEAQGASSRLSETNAGAGSPAAEQSFYTASEIAEANDLSARVVRQLAARERWPFKLIGGQFLFSPPSRLPARLPASLGASWRGMSNAKRAEVFRIKLRYECVTELDYLIKGGTPMEVALSKVAASFNFHCSASSLRRWRDAFAAKGLVGLFEDKAGKVGRKKKGQSDG